MELNAMFKSVLHRPTAVVHATDYLTQDPVEPYKVYHLQPSKEDPSHLWSPNRVFSGVWYVYFDSVQKHARSASRKLFARRELDTRWETQDMREVLSQMAGLPFGIPHAEFALANALDNRRLTCEEYVAYVSVVVVRNMDAIVWARVDRKTRLPELAHTLSYSMMPIPNSVRRNQMSTTTCPQRWTPQGSFGTFVFVSTTWQQRFAMRKSLDSAAPTSHMGLVSSSRYNS